MSPRTQNQNKEIRESRKKLIMLIALELFSREGYHGTSIARIAKGANISKGLLYNYFESKEELLKAVIMDGLREMEQYLRLPTEIKFIPEELMLMIDNVFEMVINHKDFWKLFSSVIVQPDVMEIVSGELTEVVSSQIKMITDYMEKVGSKTPKEDAYILGALFDGITLNYILNPRDFPMEIVKKRIKDIFFNSEYEKNENE
jgi:AcrR family transcriptional regulator